MIANVRKTQDDNKVQDDNLKRDKCIMCGAFHDLDDCSVFCVRQFKVRLRCCSRMNVVMVDMYIYQLTIVQGPVSSKDHGNCARKNIQLA